jgi:tetratricopeptide (TPR) repeat protein
MDQRLVYAILQYLQKLKGLLFWPFLGFPCFFFQKKKKKIEAGNADELETAIASLSKATGVSRSASELQLKARNGAVMTLESVFEIASMTAAPAVAPAPAVVSDEERETALVPANLQDKFRSYLEKLKATIYFKDVEPGTAAFGKRVTKAREKFMRKYGGGGGGGGDSAGAPPVQDPKRAEELKNAGNERLKLGDYEGAVKLYSEAIALRPDCAVYYSNRAAAYQYLSKHQLALEDAMMCVKLDKTFFKGFMRIGHSLVALGRPQQAIDEGFEPALALQPNDPTAKDALESARSQVILSRGAADMAATPGIAEMAEQLAAGRGGGPAGLEGLMNPEMIRMATEAMRDPAMQQMMQSPMFQNMAQQAAANPDMLRQMMSAMRPPQ